LAPQNGVRNLSQYTNRTAVSSYVMKQGLETRVISNRGNGEREIPGKDGIFGSTPMVELIGLD
jgi:hypothetical protein